MGWKQKCIIYSNTCISMDLILQVSLSMKDQTLHVVDESLVGVGQFFKSFMTGQHREKLCCLETFITCQDVVQWLREVTKGIVWFLKCINLSHLTLHYRCC